MKPGIYLFGALCKNTHREEGPFQEPKSHGDYGVSVIEAAPIMVPQGYNEFVSNRSIYGRVFCLLKLIDAGGLNIDQLTETIRRDTVFLLEKGEDGPGRFLSRSRIYEYVDFLRAAKWVVEPQGRLTTTAAGKSACDDTQFNHALLHAIEHEVLSDEISLDYLEEIVMELLDDMNPPTPSRIKGRLGMKGKVLDLNPATRIAIQLLPSTGRFLKGSADAIFPSALGE